MAYYSETSPTSRIISFGVVIALHVAIVWALATGLATTMMEVIKGPLQVETLMDEKKDEAAPPPPPPQTLKPPPVYVPPVEVNVAPDTTSSSNAIQSVSSAHTNPKMTSYNTKPEYPDDARHLKAEGSVVLIVDVDEKGNVSNVRVAEKSPLPSFDEAAVKAISRWRFKPATNGGVAIAQPSYKLKITFRCKEPDGSNNCN